MYEEDRSIKEREGESNGGNNKTLRMAVKEEQQQGQMVIRASNKER